MISTFSFLLQSKYNILQPLAAYDVLINSYSMGFISHLYLPKCKQIYLKVSDVGSDFNTERTSSEIITQSCKCHPYIAHDTQVVVITRDVTCLNYVWMY